MFFAVDPLDPLDPLVEKRLPKTPAVPAAPAAPVALEEGAFVFFFPNTLPIQEDSSALGFHQAEVLW